MITFSVDEQKEITAALEREGIDVSPDQETIWVYTYTVKEYKLAQKIVKDYDCTLSLYMPGCGRGANAKAAEYQIIKR